MSSVFVNHLLVSAPGCGIAALSDGAWKVVDSSDDSEALVAKLNDAKAFLDHFDGEAVLMTFGQNGERISARYNLKRAADSASAAQRLSDDDKRLFWRSVASFRLHGSASVAKRVVKRKVEKRPFAAGFTVAATLALFLGAGVFGGFYLSRDKSTGVGLVSDAKAGRAEDLKTEFPRLPHPRERFADYGSRDETGAVSGMSGRLNKISESWGTK